MKKKYVGLLASMGVACVPAIASAAGPTLSDVLVNSGIAANGYVSASYNATFNSTSGLPAGFPGPSVPLHAFDTSNNSFQLNQAALTLSYLPSSGVGALVNVIAGEDAKVINSAYSNGSNSSDFALTQGYLQYAVGNLTVIGGRFVTLAGAEVIDDSKNTNISRSLLFTNLEPLVHTGVRASYKFDDMFTGIVGVNNSAFGYSSGMGKKPKTVEVGAAITPSSTVSIALADYYGIDSPLGPQTKNNFADLVVSWQATSALQFVLNGDYVRSIGSIDTTPGYILSVADGESGGAFTGGSPEGSSSGAGGALYVNYQYNDHWKGSLRGEYLYLKATPTGGSIGSGIAHVAEATATIDYTAAKNFDLLGEFRGDYGSLSGGGNNIGVFPDGTNSVLFTQKSQMEVLVKAIFKFGTPSS
ncbi:MAG: outer membrane beta-barrel protein [Nevskia sp.]|nr:outer membrane beta-barrel protein [Nevskia sp.]